MIRNLLKIAETLMKFESLFCLKMMTSIPFLATGLNNVRLSKPPQQIRLYAHQNKLLVAIKPHDPQQQLNISAKAIAQLCNTAFKTERRIQGVQLLLCYPATQASHQEQIRILECANTLCSHIHFQTKLHLLVNQWSDEANTVWHNLPADWNTSPWGVVLLVAKNWTGLLLNLTTG